MVSEGVSMLWSSFIGKKKVCSIHIVRNVGVDFSQHQSEERLPLKFSKLVEQVTKKPVPPHVKYFIVEIMASDEEGEDVEVNLFLEGCHQCR